MVGPRITVVVPTFGRARYLDRTLRSIAEQTYAPEEVIVIDDHSPEPVVLPHDLREDVVLLRHVRNRGPGAARNTGIAHASGDWITFLDDDDLFAPRRVEQAVVGMGTRRAHATAVEYFWQDGSTVSAPEKRFEGDLSDEFHQLPHPSMGQVVFRREDVVQFHPALRVSQDTEWWLRMGHAADFAWNPQVGLRQRRHPERRPGVRRDSRLRARTQIYALHAEAVDRRARARLAGNVAAEGLLNHRRLTAFRWATWSLLLHPTAINVKRLLRSVGPMG